jgi:hypothetical protein
VSDEEAVELVATADEVVCYNGNLFYVIGSTLPRPFPAEEFRFIANKPKPIFRIKILSEARYFSI